MADSRNRRSPERRQPTPGRPQHGRAAAAAGGRQGAGGPPERSPGGLAAEACASLIFTVAEVLEAAGVGCGQRVCVALSGGVDSTVLLHLLAALRASRGFTLEAAHVHHGLSPNADAWLVFCEQTCAALGVTFHAFREHVPRGDPEGTEAAARRARQAALSRVECDWLALGHHADDQAETLLFRLLRGAGVRGAGAMAAIDAGQPGRLRPLLGVRRAELVACARALALEWVEDESNADPRYARNRLRHAVLPLIEEAFPGAVPTLARVAANFREADALLDELAAQDETACGGALMARAAVLALSDARLKNLLRWRVRRLGCQAPARARLGEAVRQLRAAERGQPLRLDLGAAVCCAYRGQVWLEGAAAAAPPRPAPWRGEGALPWGGGRVRFDQVSSSGLECARLEAAREVLLTTRWPGLAMREGAGRPRRSFKNLCQEAGIPAWLRERLPVLRVDGEAAWIGEIGMSADFVCRAGARGLSPVWER